MWQMWKNMGWPALRKSRLAWVLIVAWAVVLVYDVRSQEWQSVFSILVIGALYLMILMLTEMLDQAMNIAEPVVSQLAYEAQRVEVVTSLIRLYESQGKYAIPTDVLLTEMNKVEKKDGRITSISVVPIPPPHD